MQPQKICLKSRRMLIATAAKPVWWLSVLVAFSIAMAGCAQNRSKKLEPITWTKTSGLATSGNYYTVKAADLDNDSFVDIASGSSEPGTVAIWYSDGQGRLSQPILLPFKADVRSLDIGDINEDGRPDIVISVRRESSGLMVWINNGARRWVAGKKPIETGHYGGIRLFDINQDGHLDIIAANSSSEVQGGVQVWLGNGKGDWEVESGPSVTGMYMDVAVDDINGDLRPDIIGASFGIQGCISVWLGDGTGAWTPVPPVAFGNFYGVSIADINGDGQKDILAGTYKSGIRIFVNKGNNRFSEIESPVGTGSFFRVIASDFDGNQQVEIAATSIDGHGIRAWTMRDGSWEALHGFFPPIGIYYDIVAIDMGNDGITEWIFAGMGGGVKILSQKAWPYARTGNSPWFNISQTFLNRVSEPKENSVYTEKNGFVEYKVGPRDILEISLWEPDRVTREEVEVMPDGTISFSFVEDLQVNGLTLREIDQLLTRYLKDYIKNPKIDVRIAAYRSKYVSIMGPGRRVEGGGGGRGGEKNRADTGTFLSGKISLVEMLARTNAARPDANLREVKVRRKNGQTLKLNLYKAMTQGDKTQDIILDDGDVIYLPLISKEGNRIFVFGEVENPGAYSFTGSQMRMFDVIAAAGGPTLFAKPRYTKVVRGNIANPVVLSVDLEKLITTGDQSQNIELYDGDLVYVPRSAIGDINRFIRRIRPIVDLVTLPGRNVEYITDINGQR